MEDVVYKVCSKCEIPKDQRCFHKDKNSKDGYTYRCKECTSKYGSKWRKENPIKANQWAKENYERKQASLNKWRKENSEKTKTQSEKWRKENPMIVNRWRKENPEKNKENRNKWTKENSKRINELKIKWRKENPEKVISHYKKPIANLGDSYIKALLKNTDGLSNEIINNHPELIESKRMQMKFKRLIKHKKDEGTKTS